MKGDRPVWLPGLLRMLHERPARVQNRAFWKLGFGASLVFGVWCCRSAVRHPPPSRVCVLTTAREMLLVRLPGLQRMVRERSVSIPRTHDEVFASTPL